MFEALVMEVVEDINGCDDKERTALHFAAMRNNLIYVQILLKHGIDANLQDRAGNIALHYAVTKNNPEMVSTLIEHGSVVGTENANGFPALHLAVRDCNVQCIKILLQHGANPNKRYSMFNRVFHEINCVKKDSTESLELLLKFGAKTEVLDTKSLTPLHWACQGGNFPFAKMLLDYGAKVDYESPETRGLRGKITPLRYAVMNSEPELTKLLLEHGADPNKCDARGNTALHVAAQQSCREIVQQLLEKGANVQVKNFDGHQPLHRACICSNDSDLIRLLLQHGADPNAVNEKMEVPIHGLLWKYGRAPIDKADTNDANLREKILILLNHGAHFNLCNDQNDPFSIINNLRKLETLPQSLHLLLEASDSVNFYDSKGSTPRQAIHSSIKDKLKEMTSMPRSLKQKTRVCIRNALEMRVATDVEFLPIPHSLKQYILYK
uniref:Ankyrin-3-like n=1 Tax=Saccoglossus kowalevskii TaxID=10224 RepID=A0ABM0MQK5_SACKO|nr:PREDICTED: ankyrin-3-like [Saccoglossus kowalevskii]